MAALLTCSGRPGFYFRVLREGEVGAGDEIVKVGEAAERMTVAEINALLYFPDHPRDRLERALRIEALSHGWRGSFEALLQSQQTGQKPETPDWRLPPRRIRPRRDFSRSSSPQLIASPRTFSRFRLQSADGLELPMALPGQYVVVRLKPTAGGPTLFRSYSLSGPAFKAALSN